MQQIISATESVLFASGDAISPQKLALLVGVDEDAVRESLAALRGRYASPESGLTLIEKGDQVLLATKPDNGRFLEALKKSELQGELSRAALEVLAIVAYRAPVTRAEIESIRGVNSSFTLRNLLIRGLIERRGNPDDTRGYVYAPTFDFMKEIGLDRLSDLPDFAVLADDVRLLALLAEAKGERTETGEKQSGIADQA